MPAPNQAAETGDLQLDEADFAFFRDLIQELTGIATSSRKCDLVSARLRSHVLKLGLSSYAEYRGLLSQSAPDSPEVQTFINLLTTNKTDFFREPAHFSFLVDKVLPHFAKTAGRKISIWCGACSTGEEPYTLAMILRHHLPADRSFEILATDIDTNVLTHARNGVYRSERLAEIPEAYREQSIALGSGRAAGWFRIAPSLHSMVRFQRHNLLADEGPGREPFDIIFVRNVLIYFAADTNAKLATKMHRLLKPDGVLFIGHTESLPEAKSLFRTLRPSIFARR